VGATQFEVLTAAALAEFAGAGVEVAVVEAGLGGRLDATERARRRGRGPDERLA
jgi:dihydrofolate synthase/folylpolyglutamate synthase